MSEEPTPDPQYHNATTGTLLTAFAYASDLAFGLEFEDCLRSCFLAVRIAGEMGLSSEQRAATYYASLLKDAGCTAWTTEWAGAWQANEIVARRDVILFRDRNDLRQVSDWMTQFVARDQPIPVRLFRFFRTIAMNRAMFEEAFATSASTAKRIANRLRMPDEIQMSVLNMFEQWNGKGAPRGLTRDEIPIVARIVLPTFFLVPFHRAGGRAGATQLLKEQRGQAFDPDVADVILELSAKDETWEALESPDILQLVQTLEPETPLRIPPESSIDDLAFAFADFIDLKSRFTAAHSRRVAAVAEQIARLMGCAESAVEYTRRAGLLHDLGLVGVPSYTLERPWSRLSQTERDAYQLHPYYGERILERSPSLRPFAETVGSHHERMDGSGYYRRRSGADLNLAARIVAVADRLDEFTHDSPDGAALSISEALDQLEKEPLDPEVVRTVASSLGRTAPAPNLSPAVASVGLTNREVEVLRLVARGLTRRDIAKRLSISDNTVRHHLEHIYGKTGSTNRVTATLFAMENGLLLD